IQISTQLADLAVTAANGPPTGLAGSTVTLNWTVTNLGTGDTVASTWLDNVYADTSTTLTSSGILLGSFTHNGLLNPNDTYSQSQQVTLPITLNGAYNLFVVTDSGAGGQHPVYEGPTQPTNGTSAKVPITISQKLADLQVTGVTAPPSIASGGTLT